MVFDAQPQRGVIATAMGFYPSKDDIEYLNPERVVLLINPKHIAHQKSILRSQSYSLNA